MTLRFIVSRILRERIELAEHDADAELVDALRDALRCGDVGGVERKVPAGRTAGGGAGRDRDRPLGQDGQDARMMFERRWHVMDCGRGLFALDEWTAAAETRCPCR